MVGERGYTLSGGQRQRIAIARALLINPPILILDDATSAIDVKVEQRIHSSLRVLMEGRTTLIIAHRLSTISLADRVVLLDGGRIVADGTHADLLASTPLYSEVLAQAASEEEAAEEVAAGVVEGLGLDDMALEPDGTALAPEDGLLQTDDEVLEPERGADLMFGGGGVGPPMGGGGAPGAAQAGLPFGGIPHELQAGVDLLLAEEPDRGESGRRLHPAAVGARVEEADAHLAAHGVPRHVRAGRRAGRAHRRLHPARPEPRLLRHQPRSRRPPHYDYGVVVLMAVLYLVSIVVSGGAQWGQARVTGRLASWVMNDLRIKVFRHLQRLSLDFFTEEKAGVVMSRMTSDIENLQQLLQDGLAQFAIQGLTMVVITDLPLRHQREAGRHHGLLPCCLRSSSCRSGSSGRPSAATTRCATASRSSWPTSPRACRASASSRPTTGSATTSRRTATSSARTATPTTTRAASTASTGRARRSSASSASC